MMNTKASLIALSLAGAALLPACGGGGGDSGSSGFIPPTNDFAVLAGWQNLLATGGSWTVTGRASDGGNWEATLQATPQPAAAYPPTGASYPRMRIVSTAALNGGTPASGTVEHFRDADLRLQAVRNTGSVEVCATSTTTALPPAAAKVGAQGPLATLNNHEDCAPGRPAVGSSTVAWSLEFERGVVLLCVNSESRNAANQSIGSEKDCFEIQPDGRLGTRARITIVQPGVLNLTMKNF
ncbi:hypothetical protein [Piscinibacter sp.]|uniref:hypothetical protein n=1 Tax=Piscinibacter sp. TaxID=1903157 RepID=UPI0039E53DC4